MTNKSSSPVAAVYTVDEARDAVLARITCPEKTEQITLSDALGRITAKDTAAIIAIPPFRNSAMDGYAIRHQDYQHSDRFKVTGTALAGHPYTQDIPPGCAIKITTGAQLPATADTVVIVENTTSNGDQITINEPPVKQLYIRNLGDDISAGSLLIAKNTKLAATHLGLIAAQGLSMIDVYRKPVIGVFSTGDELCKPEQRLEAGQIYDSNRTTIQSLLQSAGFKSRDLGIAKDTRQGIQTILDSAHDCDFVLSSGGVSVGEADFVKTVIEDNGELYFWKVAMKPGKPLVTGKLNSGAYYFGLPGNPVSSVVTCLQFVIPAVQTYCGQKYSPPMRLNAICESDLTKEPGRFEFQRGFAHSDSNGQLKVTTTGMQDSHVLTSVSQANCFICLESNSSGATTGNPVPIIMFESLAGL